VSQNSASATQKNNLSYSKLLYQNAGMLHNSEIY